MRGDETLVEARVRVAFVSGGRARPIPKPLRMAMRVDRAMAGDPEPPERRPRAVGGSSLARKCRHPGNLP